MATKAEAVMVAILARLRASPSIANDIRRAHRIPVTREKSSAVYLIGGNDRGDNKESDCRRERTKALTVVLYVRSDLGEAAADSLVNTVNARLDPMTGTPYPSNAMLKQGEIRIDEELADLDAVRIDMQYEFDYQTSGWPLDA